MNAHTDFEKAFAVWDGNEGKLNFSIFQARSLYQRLIEKKQRTQYKCSFMDMHIFFGKFKNVQSSPLPTVFFDLYL